MCALAGYTLAAFPFMAGCTLADFSFRFGWRVARIGWIRHDKWETAMIYVINVAPA